MSNRIVKITLVALTMIAILPAAANAQETTGIRVSARVVSSVIPETRVAIDRQLSLLERVDEDEVSSLNQRVETRRGFAHVSTERLEPVHVSTADQTPDNACGDTEPGRRTVRITVAYTAN